VAQNRLRHCAFQNSTGFLCQMHNYHLLKQKVIMNLNMEYRNGSMYLRCFIIIFIERGTYVHDGPLSCDTMWTFRRVLIFWTNSLQPQRCRQNVPPKCWYPSTGPEGITAQMTTTDIFTAAKTSNYKQYMSYNFLISYVLHISSPEPLGL
jgi:hypothetical protein